MKKSLMVLALIAVAGSANAYTYKFHNRSNTPVHVKVTFGGPGVCGDDSFIVRAGAKHNLHTGACCLKRGYASIPGAGKHAQVSFQGTNTGFGIACRGNEFNIDVVKDKVAVTRK